MIVEILNIRIKQAYSILSQIGLFRTIVLFGFIAPFIKTKGSNYEQMISGIFLLSCSKGIYIYKIDKVKHNETKFN